MPEFQLNTPLRGHAYDALSPFAKQYVEAMFFTNGDTGDDRENLLNDLGVEKLTRASVNAIAKRCDKFLSMLMPDGRFCQQWLDQAESECGYDRGGHDLWFTQQGHGVGFWDRDEIPEALRDGLTAAAKKMGEVYVSVNATWIDHG